MAASTALACVRAPAEEICPAVGPGDLVFTEIRGPQAEARDTHGQWIEILSIRDEPVDLRGLVLRFARLDGSGEVSAYVRDPELTLRPAAHIVIGHHHPDSVPAYVDTTIFTDFFRQTDDGTEPADLYAAAQMELFACDTLVDRVVYHALPPTGSLAFDGAAVPTAEANDDQSAWCNDVSESPPDGPQTEIGLPGSPGEDNPPCP